MPTESDRLLVQQIRQGDPEAWQQLINRYEGRLHAFAVRKVRDRTAGEDIVQETFIGFWHSLPNFNENRELQTYLFTIASYKIIDHLRRTGRRPLQTGEEASKRLAEERNGERAVSSVFRSQERKELEQDAVAQSLGRMIRGWREKGEYFRIQVLELLFVKGWANKDVAKFLGISEQQVANYRFAAVQKLAKQMKDAGLSPDVFPELAVVGEGG